VDLDPARMQSFGITAAEVNDQLRQVNIDAAGGRAQVGGSEQSIRVLGGAHTAQQLANTRLMVGIALSGDSRAIRLGDIADVRDGIAEVRSISRLDGRPATTFGVLKAKGASDVDTLKRVEAELAKISAENSSINLKQVFTTVDFTKQQYHASIEALIEGALLAVAMSMVGPAPSCSRDVGIRKVPAAAPIRLTAAAKPVPSPRTSVGKISPG
jgi:multidrug efflux pump subunit AcrB